MLQFIRFEIWKNIHNLPQRLIHFWQLRELQRITKHAYSNTSLYRNLWEVERVNPNNIRKLSDLEMFPVVSKKTFLGHPPEEYIGILGPQFYRWRYTSGTNGQPFPFISINERSFPRVDFLTYRFLYQLGFSPETIQNELSLVKIYSIISREQYRSRINIPLHDLLTKTEAVIREISNVQPIVLESYPSLLIKLAQAVVNFPQFENLGIKYAISYGENLTEVQRKFIEDILHCEVFDRYGLEEFGVIGTECQYHRGLHLNVESFLLEIVDVNGIAVSLGEKGRVVITDFSNYAMPFIRYDTGDRGYFISEQCLCGLAGKRLIVEGRIGEFLTLGAKKIHHMEFDKIIKLYFSSAVSQYQIVKINEETVNLLIIPGPAMDASTLDHLQERMKMLVGDSCQLRIKLVSEVKRLRNGKCQTVINI